MATKKEPSKKPATTKKVVTKTKVVTAYRGPVTKIKSTNSYITLKLFADKFAKEHKALTTARNKYGQVLLQLLKFNRNLGIHVDLNDIEELNASNKYISLYNELYALELEISDLETSLNLFGKATDILNESPQPNSDTETL
jgi:hypothetical protein